MVYLYLMLGLFSLFFMGYTPVYFLLAGKGGFKVGSRNISGKLFIFFISFFVGALMAAWLLMMLSLADIPFAGQVIYGISAVFFIFYIYNYMSRRYRNRERKSTNRLGSDIAAARQSRRIKDKEEAIEGPGQSGTDAVQTPAIKKKPVESRTARVLFIVFAALIIINFFAVVFLTVLFPIKYWDAISCWSFKGIAFFIDSIINNFYIAHDYSFSHLSYPLYLPLMQTWLLTWMGQINENILKIIFPLFYLSLLSILYYLFRQKMGKLMSVMLVFIVSVLPIIADHGYIEYTNLLFSVLMLIAIYFFYLAMIMKGKTSFFILSAIFFSIMALTRSEGIIYVVLFIILDLIFLIFGILKKDRPLKNLLNLLMPMAVFAIFLIPWYLLKMKLGLPLLSMEWISLFNNDAAAIVSGIKETAAIAGSQLMLSVYDSTRAVFGSLYGPVWILMLIAMFFSFRSHFKDFGWIFFIFLFTGMASIFISLMLISDFANSTERYILHLFPAAYYWVMSNSIGKNLDRSQYAA